MYASKDGLGFWRAFIIALMFQFFLFGLCITLFPYVRGYIVDRAIEGDASSFLGLPAALGRYDRLQRANLRPASVRAFLRV